MLVDKHTSREELISYLDTKLGRLYSQFDVDFSYLAGSWATGNTSWWSDIDVFVSIAKTQGLTEQDQSRLLVDINVTAYQLTGIDDLNISIFELTSLHVQHDIIKNGIVIFQSDIERRHQFIEKLYTRYFDHKIWYTNYLEQSLGVDENINQ